MDDDAPVFVISVAAELSGMHPQTLRQYDRLGLVTPGRSGGGGRRYSPRDVALLREVQRLSQEALADAHEAAVAGLRRDLVPLRDSALVVWKPTPRGEPGRSRPARPGRQS